MFCYNDNMKKIILIFLTCLLLASCGKEIPAQEVQLNKTLEKLNNFTHKNDEFYNCIDPAINFCMNDQYYRLAKVEQDETYCDALEHDLLKSECKKALYLTQAFSSNNIQICEKIVETKGIQDCKNNVLIHSARAERNINMCENIKNTGDLDMKLRCVNDIYHELALDEKNPENCEKISGFEKDILQNSCKKDVEEIQKRKIEK